MKTLDIDQLYDAQFTAVPEGEEYSNFLGFVKNLFPKHTIVGKMLGSTNSGKGIELGDLFNKKKTTPAPAQPVIVKTPPVKTEKKDNTKMYMIGGGVLLLVIILIFMFTHKK